MNEQEVIALVAAQAKEAGSMRELARRWGINVSYVSDLLNGRRAPGPTILRPLGLKQVKTIEYRSIKD